MDHNLLHAILRSDLTGFIHKAFSILNPGTQFHLNWHIELIVEYLEMVRMGKIKRLIINLPPRSLKSICASVAWPAWLLGHSPTTRIIVASYAQTLSMKHSFDCKNLIQNSIYKKIFPITKIHPKHNQKAKFLTTMLGFRFAVSIGSAVTGEGGDILIVDDPHNPTHIHSRKSREKVIEWYTNTFATRLNNQNTGAIVIVMQRLHEHDLCGYLINKDSDTWTILKLPAIADKIYDFNHTYKRHIFNQGEALNPFHHNVETLKKIQTEIGSDNFEAQYMQAPTNSSKAFLKREYIAYYDNTPDTYDMILQSWDTAIKVSHNADFSVCTTWGILEDTYYLLDMYRRKLEYGDLKSSIISIATKFSPNIILIEDKASGQSLIQELKHSYNIVPQKPYLDKNIRFIAVLPLFEAHRVMIPKNAIWIEEFIKEITNFPNTEHDDIIDSISQFLNYIRGYKQQHAPRIRRL